MNCEDATRRLGALKDGELDSAEAALVRAHVGDCRRCAAERDELERLRTLLGALGAREGEADFAARLRQRAERRGRAVHVEQVRRTWPLRRAAALLLFVTGIGLGIAAGRDVASAVTEETRHLPAALLASAPPGSLEEVYLSFMSEGEWDETHNAQ